MEVPTVRAYRRENGKIGIRNHVVILPVDDISNAAAEGVASLVPQTMALSHPYGRLQVGEDLNLFFRTLIGTGSNPNVAAVIVIGIEPNWTNIVVDGIAKTGKPVAGFSIERQGDLKTIEQAAWKAREFVQWATELQTEEVKLSEMTFSTKCGESDTTSGLASNPAVGNAFEKLLDMGSTLMFGETSEVTGGEDVVAERMKTPELKEKFLKMHRDYLDIIENAGGDLLGSQPTQGNIAGGLTTIEEKALGNIQKIGKCQVDGVLEYAEAPPRHGGLWYMNSSSAAAEAVTLWAAAGSVCHLFTTGQGNIIGNPIVPVIKISANTRTVNDMAEHIDVDISGLLKKEMNLDQAGDEIIKMLTRTAAGRHTSAEVLRHKEFVLTKLHISA